MRALVLAVLAAGSAAAQDADRGRDVFLDYCATCHGTEAKGDGPMTEILLIEPPDLTQLAAGNDGVFPVTWVAQKIDGRDPVVSHGGLMPVWGDFFEGDSAAVPSEYGQPILTSEGIADLLVFLEGVQE